MTFLFLSMYAGVYWSPCYNFYGTFLTDEYGYSYLFYYYGQNGAMITLTFYKLYFILQKTEMLKTSKYTNIAILICNVIFWIIPISCILYLITPGRNLIVWEIHLYLMIFMFIILFFWANILLIYKLNRVQQIGKDEQINQIIRKIATTYSTSVFITIIYNLLLANLLVFGDSTLRDNDAMNHVLVWLAIIAWLLDVFTNFLFVMLTYKVFNPLYIRLCGKIEILCIQCLGCQICRCKKQQLTRTRSLSPEPSGIQPSVDQIKSTSEIEI